MKKIMLVIPLLFIYSGISFSQETNVDAFNPKFLNWYNFDLQNNGVLGSSVDRTYAELLKNRPSKKVIIVAVIDGGVDVNNEDLKGKIWVNENEIPNNNIDDDHNGFVDDIHGWNFIGNSKGENINYENYEYTRIYKLGSADSDYYRAKIMYEEELSKRLKEKDDLIKFEGKYNSAKKTIKNITGVEVNKQGDLSQIKSVNSSVKDATSFLKELYNNGFTEKWYFNRKKRNSAFLEKYLSLNFNPRGLIGDNPKEISVMHYGNADVIGPNAFHGTCVAGIIAGIRNNSIGVDGIATDVRIMVLRVVPDGDERDKDVALAIKYAVDNGASVVNLSFGKVFSPQRKFVNDAVAYAESKNVLIVHAAGNTAQNIDIITQYPNDLYMDNTEASNFINVGASGMEKGKSTPCFFSNYGINHVDIFAPGENIVSLDTNNMFALHSGTSQAAPVVTGIAAELLAYYPELKPNDIISILLESSLDLKKLKVQIPDLKNAKRTVVKFGTLSKSGGIVNMYNAMKLAER